MPSATRKRKPTPSHVKGHQPLQGALLIQRTRIRPDPNQVRRHLDPRAQEELNASVRRLGILQPIAVRLIQPENVYQIVAGHRRFAAASAAGLAEVPCWVQSPKEQEVLVHQIVENWQRLDIHPYDLADALVRLRDASGYTQRDLARETGKSDGEISKLLSLLELAPEVQKIARADQTGHITQRHLYALHRLPPEEQLRIIRRVQEEALCVTEVERLAAAHTEGLTGRKTRGRPASHRCFDTAHATVTVAFRTKDITTDDILTALEEARLQVGQPAPETTPAVGAT